jgi:hypothetical protein
VDRAPARSNSEAGREPAIGDTLTLTAQPDEVHAFQPETGERLGD